MGCCISSSYDTTSTHSTEEHSTAPPPHSPLPAHPSQSQSQPSRSHHHRHSRHHHHNARPPLHPGSSSSTQQPHGPLNVPLNTPINTPITATRWHSKKRRWTRPLLDRERKEFFETRVTGRPEIWAAISAALSFMRNGDLSTAQSILDAAGVTVPTGDVCQGCYDDRGVLYRLPRCVVSDPDNMVSSGLEESSGDDSEDDEEGEDTDGGVDVGFSGDDRKGHGLGFGSFDETSASGDELIASNGGNDDVERERRRDEKGKTSERDLICVKARLSDRGGVDVAIVVKKTQNVGFIARKVQHEVGIPRTQRVRIAYLGKILKEHTPLVEQGWKPGHVVNALVVARRSSS